MRARDAGVPRNPGAVFAAEPGVGGLVEARYSG